MFARVGRPHPNRHTRMNGSPQRRGVLEGHPLRALLSWPIRAQSFVSLAGGSIVGFALLAVLLTCTGSHAAQSLSESNAVSPKIGIVYMHGTGSSPEMQHEKAFYGALREAGYLVETPEMCWSARRMYDRPFSDCMKAVPLAIAKLKNAGAMAIVVAGHSFGGNAAIQYGATHTNLLGVLVLSAAFDPRILARDWEVRASIAKAQGLIDKGRGDAVDSFLFTTAKVQLRTKATVYLSFNGPRSLDYMPANTPKLTAPLLWIAGDRDFGQPGPGYAFDKAPATPLNRYVAVSGNHVTVLSSGVEPALAWLDELRRFVYAANEGKGMLH
jgi:pimeloyl-ACP methyl ester carboxylesterase